VEKLAHLQPHDRVQLNQVQLRQKPEQAISAFEILSPSWLMRVERTP